MLSNTLLANVKQAEGLRLIAYKDSLGFDTIGYGHKLAPGHSWLNYTITPDAASGMLIVDLTTAALQATKVPEWPRLDTSPRQDALIELVYNMGATKWLTFTNTRAAIQAQMWPLAHDQLLNSLWARQVGLARSTRIANQFKTGTYA